MIWRRIQELGELESEFGYKSSVYANSAKLHAQRSNKKLKGISIPLAQQLDGEAYERDSEEDKEQVDVIEC